MASDEQKNAVTASRPRLLVVDDDPDLRQLVGGFAEAAGFDWDAACDFNELRALQLERYSVLVLDLMLPEVDGIEILRYLAARESRVGIVLVSRSDRRVIKAAHRLADALGLHAVGSMSKPFDGSALNRLLESFRPSLTPEAMVIPPSVTLAELRRGMSEGEIQVHYQPKIEVHTLQFVAVEALVRWQHPTLGFVAPNVFIDLAERSGLIGALTEQVMRRAFAQSHRWQRDGLDLKLAVNVSTRSLNNLDLPDTIRALAAEHSIDPARIVIEITESWLGNDEVTALDILTRLRMKGFQLSIDDFGTGYATMLQLKQIPFSELKLDQSFIRGAATDEEARIIVESSIELGQRLGLHVVAEGVERQEDWDLISELGCDEGQGYFIARPMRAEDVPSWVRRWTASLGHG